MVGCFVGMWSYLLLVIALHVVVAPPPRIIQWALLPVFGLVIAAGFLQFSARCPSCGARLGLQSRLLVPEHCRVCGAALRITAGEVADD